jgi:hypothetical protein
VIQTGLVGDYGGWPLDDAPLVGAPVLKPRRYVLIGAEPVPARFEAEQPEKCAMCVRDRESSPA